jgi:hypothetical protein
MKSLISRKISVLVEKLQHQGKAILILGARQVGKTTLLRSFQEQNKQVLWLNADETSTRSRLNQLSIDALKGIVGNYKTVIIDEIQRIENSGLLLKVLVDHFKDVQFFATGSSSLEIGDQVFEAMTGRAFTLYLYPFGISELYPELSPFELEQKLPFHLVYGTYPEVTIKRDISEVILNNLAQQYLYKDVLVWKDIRKPDLLDKLLKLLAYQLGSEVSINELAKKLQTKSETIENYIDLLEKAFVVYRLKAYSTNPRKEVSKMSKIYFWDNGIRNAVIGDYRSLSERNDHGALFENFLISERQKNNAWQLHQKAAYFWRNYNQSEVDYVEKDGLKLTAFEIKWNTMKNHKVSQAFVNLYPDAKTKIITPMNMMEFINY